MKPTQEQALDWAFECDFVESSPAEDVFSAIYVCCPKDIERLVILAYEAGRKDENEACAQIAFNAKTYIEPPFTAPPQREFIGLTDEEQNQVAWSCGAMSADWLEFACAIETKLKEKNL